MPKLILIVLACLLTSAFPQAYPRVGTAEHLYQSFDFPAAAPGDNYYWQSMKQGPDAMLVTLRYGGNLHLYSSWWGMRWGFQATSDPDDIYGMKNMVMSRNWDLYDHDVSNVPDTTIVKNNKVYITMANIYKAGNGDLYGLLHVEDNGPCLCPPSNPGCEKDENNHVPQGGHNIRHPDTVGHPHDSIFAEGSLYCPQSEWKIGLARCAVGDGNYPCENTGWTFLGIILKTQAGTKGNIGGVPYLIIGDYIYVYFNETPLVQRPGISVARALISDMELQAVSNQAGDVGSGSPWKKYKGPGAGCSVPSDAGCWTEDPFTGRGAPLLPNPVDLVTGVVPPPAVDCDYGPHCLDMHTDATYSTVTGKYYLLVTEQERVTNFAVLDHDVTIWLYESTDGVTWTNPVMVAKEPLLKYPGIVPLNQDLTSDDGSGIGSQFYVVYSKIDSTTHADPNDPNVPPTWFPYSMDIYRKKITLTAPNPAARIDYDGDGKADLSTKEDGGYGDFHIDLSSNGFGSVDVYASNSEYGGGAYDVAAPADYDGDGLTDIGIKREDGNWVVDYAVNGFGYPADAIYGGWGDTNYRPVPADYDGDGKADLAVVSFDGNNGGWAIDSSSNGFRTDLDIPEHADLWSPDTCYPTTCHAVPADYDGDGKTDRGLKLDWSTGVWWIDTAANGFRTTWDNYYRTGWGDETHKPAPADYDGDGKADLAVLNEYGQWFIDWASNGFTNNGPGYPDDYANGFTGSAGTIPVPSDYDGDGKADLAAKNVYGTWEIDYSSDGWGNIETYTGWGDSTAHPLHKKAIEAAVLKNTGGQISFGFTLPSAASVKIEAYGIDGKRIATLFQGNLGAGGNRVGWSRKEMEGKGLKRGLYFLSLSSKDLKVSRKLVFSE